MTKRKKLLVFVQSNVGGAERMTVTITKSLDREKFEVVYYLVGMTSDNSHPLVDFIPKDLKVNIIPKTNPLVLMLRILMAMVKEKPDVVFSSVLYLNNKVLLYRTLFQKTNFVIRCENYLYTFSDKQKNMIDRLYPKADIIIAQTDEMKQELVEQMAIPESKLVVMQNPIDRETIDKKISEDGSPYDNKDVVRFVASGRFSEQKGFDMLASAFAIVAKELPNSELYILGKEDKIWYGKTMEIVNVNNLSERVHCIGYQNNPYKYVKNADCFVLSSRWEGLPNVLIESLYLGTPVAAMKCIPVIERIVTDGKDGYLAEKENVDSLAEAMLNAVKLGRIQSNYRSATVEDFHYIFENNKKPMIHNVLQVGGGNIKRTLKNLVRNTWPVSWLLQTKKEREDKQYAALRAPYIPQLESLLDKDTSIISSNCFAGRVMQDLGMQYNTPTLGLYIWYPDYIDFLSNLKYYLTEAKIEFVEHSKYPLGDERRKNWKHWYPIGILGGKVEIAFLHYHTEEEAAEKWYRRASRINWNKLLVIGMEQNLCTEDDIRAFDKLPFENKTFFSTKELPECKSNCYMKEFANTGEAGDPYKYGHLYYKNLIDYIISKQ